MPLLLSGIKASSTHLEYVHRATEYLNGRQEYWQLCPPTSWGAAEWGFESTHQSRLWMSFTRLYGCTPKAANFKSCRTQNIESCICFSGMRHGHINTWVNSGMVATLLTVVYIKILCGFGLDALSKKTLISCLVLPWYTIYCNAVLILGLRWIKEFEFVLLRFLWTGTQTSRQQWKNVNKPSCSHSELTQWFPKQCHLSQTS